MLSRLRLLHFRSDFCDIGARTAVLALEIRRDRDVAPSGIYSALYIFDRVKWTCPYEFCACDVDSIDPQRDN